MRQIEEKVVGGMHIEAAVAAPPYVSPPVVSAPAYVAPYVAPYVPPYAPPFTEPVAAVRKAKPVPTRFLEEHKKIKTYIDKQGKAYLCPTISEIAEKTGLSEDDVRLHLDVMDEDEAVVSVQKIDNSAICSVDALSRLAINLRKLRT